MEKELVKIFFQLRENGCNEENAIFTTNGLQLHVTPGNSTASFDWKMMIGKGSGFLLGAFLAYFQVAFAVKFLGGVPPVGHLSPGPNG